MSHFLATIDVTKTNESILIDIVSNPLKFVKFKKNRTFSNYVQCIWPTVIINNNNNKYGKK